MGCGVSQPKDGAAGAAGDAPRAQSVAGKQQTIDQITAEEDARLYASGAVSPRSAASRHSGVPLPAGVESAGVRSPSPRLPSEVPSGRGSAALSPRSARSTSTPRLDGAGGAHYVDAEADLDAAGDEPSVLSGGDAAAAELAPMDAAHPAHHHMLPVSQRGSRAATPVRMASGSPVPTPEHVLASGHSTPRLSVHGGGSGRSTPRSSIAPGSGAAMQEQLEAEIEERRRMKGSEDAHWLEEQARREREELALEQERQERERAVLEAEQRRLAAEQNMDQFEQQENALMGEEDAFSRQREEIERQDEHRVQAELALKLRAEQEVRMQQLRAEAAERDAADLRNPDLVSFKVIFPNEALHEVYRYHLPRDTATLLDLKLQVNMDFGYAFTQQRFFYKFKEIEDDQVLVQLPGWSGNSALLFFPTGQPVTVPEHIARPRMHEPTIAELRQEHTGTGEAGSWPVFRDWTLEWWSLVNASTESPLQELEAAKSMYELMEDFVDCAEAAVDQVVRGALQPSFCHELFGCGGDKYFVGGILVRRAAKWEVLGESVGEGDSAFKAAGLELKALSHLRAAKLKKAVVPPACVVDHLGHRFLCVGAADLTHMSLVYGSSNDALTVVRGMHADAEVAAKEIADAMNVKAHDVVERLTGARVQLYTPHTLELHRAESGPLVVANAARLLPPDAPAAGQKIDHLVKLMRPEFVSRYAADEQKLVDGFVADSLPLRDRVGGWAVRDGFLVAADEYENLRARLLPAQSGAATPLTFWKNATGDVRLAVPSQRTPLNPDAYTTPDRRGDVDELAQASRRLQEVAVARLIDDLNTMELAPFDGAELTEAMHKRGVNVRNLGRVAHEATLNHVREMSVREMLARTVKVLIRDGLSFLEKYDEHDAKTVVLHYLNEVFTSAQTEGSLTLWKYIDELCYAKFAYVLEETVRDKIYLVALLHAICSKVGVSLSRYKGYDFGMEAALSLDDITRIQPVCKRPEFVSEHVHTLVMQARELDAKGRRKFWYMEGGPERAEATKKLHEAVTMAEFIYGREHPHTADVYVELAAQLESRHQEKGRPQNSRWNRAGGVARDELSEQAEKYYQLALQIYDGFFGFYHRKVARCYLGLARVMKDEPPERVLDCVVKAVDIVESLCGFNHPETALAYQTLALLHQELVRNRESAPWIRKAFMVYVSLLGTNHDVSRNCWRQLQAIELSIDSGLEHLAIEALPARIEELAFS